MELKIPGYSDFENGEIEYSKNTVKKIKNIGGGTFSEVYKAINLPKFKLVAIKVLKQDVIEHDTKEKILREVKILEALKGGPGIIDLIAVVKDRDTEFPALVTELIDSESESKIKKSVNY